MALSELVRAAARHTATERDFTAMIDLANRLRPQVEWRPRIFRGEFGEPAAANTSIE
jgi:hypothetical protein